MCVPLDLLPRRGPLTANNGDEIDAEVVTVDWQRRLVLLQVPASAVAGSVAVRVGAAARLTTVVKQGIIAMPKELVSLFFICSQVVYAGFSQGTCLHQPGNCCLIIYTWNAGST